MQPKGFEIFNSESHVCRLKRALYGLKQAPRAWYTRINNYFTGLGFTKSEAGDDLILTSDEKLIHSCKEDLAKKFEMKDMGLLHYFLG